MAPTTTPTATVEDRCCGSVTRLGRLTLAYMDARERYGADDLRTRASFRRMDRALEAAALEEDESNAEARWRITPAGIAALTRERGEGR